MSLSAEIMNLPVPKVPPIPLTGGPSAENEARAYKWGHRDARHAAAELAVAHEAANGWQPIETAPRDSKARLVWVPENKCVFCVTWTNGDVDGGSEGPARPGWVIFGGGYRSYLRDGGPTHWTPLPKAPA